MSDEYDRYLRRVHADFAAPDEVIQRAAQALTRSPIATKTRIVAGEANEVYALRFADDVEVIMRIARHSQCGFAHEVWALAQCAELGIPVPKMLLVDQFESSNETLDVCIMEKINGARLSDSLALPRSTLRAIVNEVGEFDSRMHTIVTTGVGDLDGSGAAPFAGMGPSAKLGWTAARHTVANRPTRGFDFMDHSAGIEDGASHNSSQVRASSATSGAVLSVRPT